MVLVAAVFLNIDLFHSAGLDIVGIEESEAGEVAVGFLLVIPAFFLDRVLSRQRAHEAQLAAERLRVVQVTMRTVQDIVNNGLNQLQFLRFDAEGHVPPESLALFDEAIRDTITTLTALGDVQTYAEKQLAVGGRSAAVVSPYRRQLRRWPTDLTQGLEADPAADESQLSPAPILVS
jgi:hypothetical protein